MNMRVLLPLLLLLAAAAKDAGADPLRQDGLNWLQTMAFAAHQTDYSGTFIYQYGNHVETSRITHVTDRAGEHGRLEGLDGPRREIIRNNDQVLCYYGDRQVRVEPRQGDRQFPSLLPSQLSLLNENYLIKQVEDGRVAGFNTHTIIMQPKDHLRYTHKMWAHNDSGLLLKAAVLDDRGAVIEQYEFTQLNLGGNIDHSWIPVDKPNSPPGPHPESGVDPHHAYHGLHRGGLPKVAHHLAVGAEALPVASGWQVDALPAGFRKVAEVQRQLPGKDVPVIQLVFSDGLAGISVFIEQADNDEDDYSGLSSQGIVQVYTKLLDGQLLTVVGEVPPRTVMQVADSVRFAREH
ncbi:MAG: MucB/RseB C-terminal domain-containing protein [Nitrosomonadales bacterium]|nr:MucB/RseB C-terminal domain-containing protein [Nitrosomonadales bacterium]